MAPQTLAHEHLNEHLCSHSRRGSGRAQAPRGTLPAYGCFLFEEKSLVCNPRCRKHLEKKHGKYGTHMEKCGKLRCFWGITVTIHLYKGFNQGKCQDSAASIGHPALWGRASSLGRREFSRFLPKKIGTKNPYPNDITVNLCCIMLYIYISTGV